MITTRYVVPGAVQFVTRRCLERRHFLQPSPFVNQLLKYLLAVGSERWDIELLSACFMSNHCHLGLHDAGGVHPRFTAWFFGEAAKLLNLHRGRTDKFWDARRPHVGHLVDAGAILDKLVYTMANPVKHHVVPHAEEWPGFCSTPTSHLHDEIIERPPGLFPKNTIYPETATLRFHRPPSHDHLSPEAWTHLLQTHLGHAEREAQATATRTGRRFLGRTAACSQHWDTRATTPEPPTTGHGSCPDIIARSPETRRAALTRLFTFRRQHEYARRDWLDGVATPFPHGTWRAHRHYGLGRTGPLSRPPPRPTPA